MVIVICISILSALLLIAAIAAMELLVKKLCFKKGRLLYNVISICGFLSVVGIYMLGLHFTFNTIISQRHTKVLPIIDITEEVKALKPGETIEVITLDEYYAIYGRYYEKDRRRIKFGIDHPDMMGRYR